MVFITNLAVADVAWTLLKIVPTAIILVQRDGPGPERWAHTSSVGKVFCAIQVCSLGKVFCEIQVCSVDKVL